MTAQHRLPPWHLLACLAVFAIVMLARGWYVDAYALPLPYWDQWDSEGDFLLRPWIEGTFKASDLWQLHNEHRILPTRLTSLALYELTGEWNNRYSAFFNVVLAAMAAASLLWLGLCERGFSRLRWLLVPVVVACFALPSAWENILVGFQSQFYYLMLFTIASIALAAWRPADGRAIAVILLLALMSMLTMASGLVTAGAVIIVYGVSHWQSPLPRARLWAAVAPLVVMSLIAYGTTPSLEHHAALHARNALNLVDAFNHALGWPYGGYHWAAAWLWLPVVITAPLLLARRALRRTDLAMMGLAAWSFGQAIVVAYGRGSGLLELASRYSELMTLGLVANAWFAARMVGMPLPRTRATYPATVVAVAFALVSSAGWGIRFEKDMASMSERRQQAITQTRHVRDYLVSKDPSTLRQPHLHIPYPVADRLQSLLDNPALRGAMSREIAGGDTGPPRPELLQ